MIYGWLGELIKSPNRTPGSITTAINTLYGLRMATTTFLSACLSFEHLSLFLSKQAESRERTMTPMNLIHLHGYSTTELGF